MNTFVQSNEELYHNLDTILNIRFLDSGQFSLDIGLNLVSCDFQNKTATFSHVVKDAELNFRKVMHGGLVTWLLDTAMGMLSCSYSTTRNPTLSLTTNYLTAIKTGDYLEIIAKINKIGSHIATVEGSIDIVRPDGSRNLAATAVATYYRLDPEPLLFQTDKDTAAK